jgi:hypothetical protein
VDGGALLGECANMADEVGAMAEPIKMTPEHDERVRRIARLRNQTPEQVLSDILTEYWVRFAGSKSLKPGDW